VQTPYICVLQILRNPPPGIDELVALAGVIKLARSEQYKFDRVIIDTAPTGHTLRLLSFPDFLDQFLDKASHFLLQICYAVVNTGMHHAQSVVCSVYTHSQHAQDNKQACGVLLITLLCSIKHR
jgi:anion-transporting  ArsA/GET3 family ATPase